MSATLLVVEDDSTIAETIRDVLVGAGYRVPDMAASGHRALQIAAASKPALVLMDVQLDGPLDGIETAQRLRDEHAVRVVYLTAFADDSTLRRAKLTTPLGYLKKPFNARELLVAVEIALQQAALEAALAAREQWFATTLQSIGDAVVTTDGDDRVTFLNRAAQAIVGGQASESLGKKVEEVVRLVDRRGSALPIKKRDSGGHRSAFPLPNEARLARNPNAPASPTVEIEGSVAPIAFDVGSVFGTVMVFRDVSERRQLERRLGMTERLAAIGTMAAGMQHEINNPLASVVANVQYALDVLRARRDGASREELAELVNALEDASDGAERVRRTVEELRHFSRGPEVDEPIALSSAIEDALRMTAHAVRHHATVRREFGRAPRVRAEEGQLARVFMNLLLNAAQATGDGAASQHTIVLTTRTDSAGRAVAEVTDDGPGIAPEMIHRIFDPFFTTPLEHSAMGLGLAVCHSIVTSLGGEIDVESELGKGTTFRVSLPPAAPVSSTSRPPTMPPPALPDAGSEASARGRGKVLVVDDEIAIGKAIRRILGSEHEVTLESDARTALDRLARERYDVVFCDLMMPNMSGMDFFDEVAARFPSLAERIVFLTGGAFSPRSEEFLRSNRNICLSKPFSRESVSSAVRRMLTPST
ncbi:MAG: Sensory box histidine kinase/response regulator [Labilithrix sp.]|nr:Sensory box histidine kinase/response regulator [Labilithrix sp.]